MTPRALLEQAGVIWTRRERRRLARVGAGRGRRRAVDVPRTRPRMLDHGTRDAYVWHALLAAPGLRLDDINVSTPAPGAVRVALSGPRATASAVADIYLRLRDYVPMCLEIEVVVP